MIGQVINTACLYLWLLAHVLQYLPNKTLYSLLKKFQNDVPSQAHDSSVSSTYNGFKIPGAFFASTQVHNVASTSNKSLTELEAEVKNLKQKNEEKEGEILILRSRIRETNSTIKAEQQRTTSEWREKYHSVQKEVKSITSDLEFKVR